MGPIGQVLLELFLLVATVQIVLVFFALNKFNTTTYRWLKFTSVFNVVLTALVFSTLLFLFVGDHFEYYQVWRHSSKDIPIYYKIAALWEGQEGSFLLWALVQGVAMLLIFRSKNKVSVLAAGIVLFVQAFLLMPLLTGMAGDTGSLFSRTIEVLNIPSESMKADWTIRDGKGMNPLLINFWMTIHPPVIFLSFAWSCIPYAFAISGIYWRDNSWLSTAHRWMKYSMIVLTLGLLMGAYWAYETLNFGGYWSWDPVENAVYLPWLIGIAAIHVNRLAASEAKYVRASFIMNSLYFIAIVYSTFLTRSGVLSELSVHAFVDGGYKQVLTGFLTVTILLPLIIGMIRLRSVSGEGSITFFRQRSKWSLIATLILLLAAFQVFIYTSMPLISKSLQSFGFDVSVAPAPGDSYSRWQGFFAILMTLALVIVERFEGRIQPAKLLIGAVGFGVLFTVLSFVFDLPYAIAILLTLSSALLLLVLVRKGTYLFRMRSLSRSFIAHVGMVILITGIVLSGKVLHSDLTAPEHRLLEAGTVSDTIVNDYYYAGRFVKDDYGDLIERDALMNSMRADQFIARRTITTGHRRYQSGDIVEVKQADRYYLIRSSSKDMSCYAHVYFQSEDDYFITPYIEKGLVADTYLNISNIRDDNKIVWKDSIQYTIIDNVSNALKVAGTQLLSRVPGLNLNREMTAHMVFIEVDEGGRRELFSPVIIEGPGIEPYTLDDFHVSGSSRLAIRKWVDQRNFEAVLSTSDRDWITVQISEKPAINLVWLGGLMIAGGIGISLIKKKQASKAGKANRTFVNTMSIGNRSAKKRNYAYTQD